MAKFSDFVVQLYCGIKSEMGQIIQELRHAFNSLKADVASQIDELLGSNTTKAFMDSQLGSQKLSSSEGTLCRCCKCLWVMTAKRFI